MISIKACPKDNFPLPSIDMIIDSIIRYGILHFINDFCFVIIKFILTPNKIIFINL